MRRVENMSRLIISDMLKRGWLVNQVKLYLHEIDILTNFHFLNIGGEYGGYSSVLHCSGARG